MPTSASAVYTVTGDLELVTPYNKHYVELLKDQIPAEFRTYDPVTKVWVIHQPYQLEGLHLFRRYFPTGTISDKRATGSASRPASDRQVAVTPREVLFLLPNAPTELISAAYKTLSRLYHPDLGGDVGQMQRINQAYDQIRQEAS